MTNGAGCVLFQSEAYATERKVIVTTTPTEATKQYVDFVEQGQEATDDYPPTTHGVVYRLPL